MAHPLHLDEVDPRDQHRRASSHARQLHPCRHVQAQVTSDDTIQPKLHTTPRRFALRVCVESCSAHHPRDDRVTMSTTKHEVYQQMLFNATATVTYEVRPFATRRRCASVHMCACAQVPATSNKTTPPEHADHLYVFDSCLCVVYSRSASTHPPHCLRVRVCIVSPGLRGAASRSGTSSCRKHLKAIFTALCFRYRS